MDKNRLETIYSLRKTLHEHPEISEQEVKTREILKDFLKEHTSVEIVDKGRWFYAVKREEGAKETIVFRGDHDAILSENGKAFHGCGHDGHSAILAGLAWELETVNTGKNIVYLFQHAEENGAGAKEAVEIFDEIDIDRIYGLHNWPHYELGEPFVKKGTFMCASKGMRVSLEGKQSHASEPENGINPAYLIAELIEKVKPLVEFHGYEEIKWEGQTFESMVLCTIIHVKVGEQGAFGVSPSRGEISFTLRAARMEDLDVLSTMLEDFIQKRAVEMGITFDISYSDEFPDTTNSDEGVDELVKIFEKHGVQPIYMKEPIRSSEDFGWYQKRIPGVFFGVGAGVDHPDLHTTAYEFPDEIIEKAIDYFTWIAID